MRYELVSGFTRRIEIGSRHFGVLCIKISSSQLWGAWDEARHQRHFAECIELGEINIIELNGERAGIIQIFDRRSS